MSYETGTITGTFKLPDGTAREAAVHISLNVPKVRDQDGNEILAGEVVTALSGGALSVVTAASDDPTLDPTNVDYRVVIRWTDSVDWDVYPHVFVPSDGVIDLADVGTLDPAAPTYQEFVNAAQVAAAEAAASASAAGSDAGTAENVADTDSLTRAALDELYGGGGGGPVEWDDVQDKPATFAPTLPIAQAGVTSLVADLAAKASTSGLAAEAVLARNADNLTSGTVADARIAASIARDSEVTAAVAAEAVLRTAADDALTTALTSKADLVGGVVPTSQIPAIALTTGQVVANRAALLALTAQAGDLGVITATADKGSYILTTADPTVFANWLLLSSPTDVVVTVNGQTGTVVLGKSDVGLGSADNTSDTAKPVSTAQQTALDLKAPLASPTFTGTVAGVTKTHVGLGNVDNTSNATERAAVATLTNKRITKRIVTTADTATLTIASDDYDGATVTALAQAMTIAAPTGTPTEMQALVIRIKDNGTARALTWNAAFVPVGVTLPTTTVLSKVLYVGAMWNGSVWHVLAVGQEA